ncbi:MAG: phosphodiester glycosidase family protein [Clostridia bacterium]|jgi:exopolysaccharide biosynthesis protein
MFTKKRLFKKIWIAFMAFVMAASPLFGLKNAFASDLIYYESVSKETFAAGIDYENIVRFTSAGWQNIHVLYVDVKNPYVKLETFVNTDSLVIPKTVKEFAEEAGAVAAINGSFFNTTHVAGETAIIGPVVESGKVKTASYDFNRNKNQMATFSVDRFDNPLIDYWKVDLYLVNQRGKEVPVGRYNMPYYGYNDLTVLDRNWGEYSPGSANSDFVEMVIENGRVTDIRNYKPAVRIPENGFVVVTKKAGVHLFNSNFKIGETVRFEVRANLDVNKIQNALTGGGVLVKDGVIPSSFSHSITGTHPRTAIGITKDGGTVIMVAVDGRQQGSKGMTQEELARLMQELGAYNALNFDGGGSTTMVGRKTGSKETEVLNNPSDGYLRKVPAAIGVVSVAPASAMSKLYIRTEDDAVFVNTGRIFTVTATDANGNLADLTGYNPVWSVKGVEGVFKGNTFYPSSTGRGTVTAKVGLLTAELDILVLDEPVSILPPSDLYAVAGETTELPSVIGRDKNGMEAMISAKDIQWSFDKNEGGAKDGLLTPYVSGTDTVTLSVGKAKAYAVLRVARGESKVLDSFENLELYSAGALIPSYGQKVSGYMSGMLNFNLLQSNPAVAAYKGEGLLIDKDVSELSIRVYANMKNYNKLTGEIVDANGKKQTVVFAESMDWTGWRTLKVSVEKIAKPARLTGFSVSKTKEGSNFGYILLDDLQESIIRYPQNAVTLPNVPKPSDGALKPTVSLRPEGDFRFAVMGQAENPSLRKEIATLADTLNNLYDFAAFPGEGAMKEALALHIPSLDTKEGYSFSYQKDNLIIRLDTKNKSLTSKPEQWKRFLDELDKANAKNVFIFMTNGPGAFSDRREAKLFVEKLEEYRRKKFDQVWVFSEGSTDSVRLEKGVRYMEFKKISETEPLQFMLVTINGNDVSYQYKNVK